MIQAILAHVEGAPHIHGHEAVGIVGVAIVFLMVLWAVVKKENK